MKKLFILIFWSLFALTGCMEKSTNLQQQFTANDSKVYRDTFHIRGKAIPLPPGEWKVIASGFDSEKFYQLYLVQEHPGKIFQWIYICVDSIELNRENGYKPHDEPKRLDVHHTTVNKNVDGEPQNWWIINNMSGGLIKKEGRVVLNTAVDYVASHLVVSNDYIYAQHHLTGSHPNKKRYLAVEYYYNPEVAGFSPGEKTMWRNSEWNATRVNEDPRKAAFVKELIKKHGAVHEQLKAGFHPGS